MLNDYYGEKWNVVGFYANKKIKSQIENTYKITTSILEKKLANLCITSSFNKVTWKTVSNQKKKSLYRTSAEFQNLLSSLFFDYFSTDSCKILHGCQRLFTEGRSNKFYCGEGKDLKIIWNQFSCPIYITAPLCCQYSFSSLCWQTGRWNHSRNRLIETAVQMY